MIIIKTNRAIEETNIRKKKKSRNKYRTNQMIMIIIDYTPGSQLSVSFASI